MPAPLSRETLSDQMAQRLWELITVEQLEPGASLPSEQKLADKFDVSRPVVREALKALVGQGIIEKINGKGAVIKPLDSEPLRLFFRRAVQIEKSAMIDLSEVRMPLEVQSARLAAERRDAKDLEDMQAVITDMRGELQDRGAFAQLDAKLHVEIARASRNDMMHHLISSIRDSLQSVSREGLRRLDAVDHGQLEQVQQIHERLFQEIERGNPIGAERAMRVHFDKAFVAMQQIPNDEWQFSA